MQTVHILVFLLDLLIIAHHHFIFILLTFIKCPCITVLSSKRHLNSLILNNNLIVEHRGTEEKIQRMEYHTIDWDSLKYFFYSHYCHT